jgi:hypothetical protein
MGVSSQRGVTHLARFCLPFLFFAGRLQTIEIVQANDAEDRAPGAPPDMASDPDFHLTCVARSDVFLQIALWLPDTLMGLDPDRLSGRGIRNQGGRERVSRPEA